MRGLFWTHLREIVAAALLLLPPLLLIPLGAVWLWQRGHGLWFLALCLIAAMPAGFLVLRRRLAPPPPDVTELPGPEPDWPEREREAFEKLQRFATTVPALSLEDREEAFELGRRTIELVARHYRSDAARPLAAFTLPEALLLMQRVAARLRWALLEGFPFSDRLTLAQLLWAYDSMDKAQPFIRVGSNIYDAYRAVRPVVNPAGAAIAEARRLIFDAAWGTGKDYLRRQLTKLFVLEIGKTAIELYSGRLRRDQTELEQIATAVAREGASASDAMPSPLRILIAGQTNAGKSSLLNALARDILAPVSPLPGPPGFQCFEATDPEGGVFVFVDAPGFVASPQAVASLADEARKADIILWTIAVHQAARAPDAEGIKTLRGWFAARPQLNRPPLLCVATHVDQLRPFAEWDPPYNIAEPDRPKGRAIRAAIEAIAADLEISPGSIVPVSLRPDREPYNLDALRTRIADALPEARYAQLARAHAAAGKISWWKELDRLMLASRTLFRAV